MLPRCYLGKRIYAVGQWGWYGPGGLYPIPSIDLPLMRLRGLVQYQLLIDAISLSIPVTLLSFLAYYGVLAARALFQVSLKRLP